MIFNVGGDYDGRPLRELLRRELHVSAKLLARLKRDEAGILVNGERATVRRLLHTGDAVSLLDFACERQTPLEPVFLPFGTAYEDEYLIVADKPPFMPTHPSRDHHNDTLANALAYYYRDSGTPFAFRPVSRLDRNTSGLVTVAKTKYVSSLLNTQMKNGEFHKTYFAILDGEPPEARGEIRTGLRRSADSIIVREVCPPDTPGAAEAITEYELIAAASGHSLVRVRPLTGRTHQIRVHFASVGAPVTGDDLYGHADTRIARHALHASALDFEHPVSRERLSLTSPLPDDMARLCAELFGDAGVLQYT